MAGRRGSFPPIASIFQWGAMGDHQLRWSVEEGKGVGVLRSKHKAPTHSFSHSLSAPSATALVQVWTFSICTITMASKKISHTQHSLWPQPFTYPFFWRTPLNHKSDVPGILSQASLYFIHRFNSSSGHTDFSIFWSNLPLHSYIQYIFFPPICRWTTVAYSLLSTNAMKSLTYMSLFQLLFLLSMSLLSCRSPTHFSRSNSNPTYFKNLTRSFH